MASLSRHRNAWKIEYLADGKRKSFYPGKMHKRHAEAFTRHLEVLQSARTQRTAIPGDTAAWLAAQDTKTRIKLFDHGLIDQPEEARPEVATIGEFTESYIKNRGGVKQSSKIVWRRCRRLMLTYFGANKPMQAVTIGDAKDFRNWMLREGGRENRGLGENTVRKMCSVASQFFTDALDREIVTRNPFAHRDIPRTTRENRKRDHFIDREMTAKILEACPDAEWRLLFALSRFGGLRCPSEHLSLKWEHIVWDQGRMIVQSPKTEHHEGKGQRVVPIFPELLPFLEEQWELIGGESEFVIARYRNRNANLRTQLERIINRAGLATWPKLFHNLRASRETELAQEFPIHVVCAWIGNSVAVASRHYLQITDDVFTKATAEKKAPQNAPQQVHVRDCEEMQSERGEKNRRHKNRQKHPIASTRNVVHKYPVDVTGLEPVTSSV